MMLRQHKCAISALVLVFFLVAESVALAQSYELLVKKSDDDGRIEWETVISKQHLGPVRVVADGVGGVFVNASSYFAHFDESGEILAQQDTTEVDGDFPADFVIDSAWNTVFPTSPHTLSMRNASLEEVWLRDFGGNAKIKKVESTTIGDLLMQVLFEPWESAVSFVLDWSGQTLWAHRQPLSEEISGYAAESLCLPDGDVVLLATFVAEDTGASGEIETELTQVLSRFSATGELLWSVENDSAPVYSLAYASDVIVGAAGGEGRLPPAHENAVVVNRWKGNGEFLSSTDYVVGESANWVPVFSVFSDPEGSIYVLGAVSDCGLDYYLGYSIEGFVMKVDADGQRIWLTRVGANRDCSSVEASVIDAEGSVFLHLSAGNYNGESKENWTCVTKKLDVDGNVVWTDSHHDLDLERWWDSNIAIDGEGNLFTAIALLDPEGSNDDDDDDDDDDSCGCGC